MRLETLYLICLYFKMSRHKLGEMYVCGHSDRKELQIYAIICHHLPKTSLKETNRHLVTSLKNFSNSKLDNFIFLYSSTSALRDCGSSRITRLDFIIHRLRLCGTAVAVVLVPLKVGRVFCNRSDV